jgi:serine/threonine-protein kinase
VRVIRGGDSGIAPCGCRSAARLSYDPQSRMSSIGFRVSLTVDAVRRAQAQAASHSPADAWTGWPADGPPPALAPFDADQAQAHQAAWAAHLGVPVEHTNLVGMTFRLIPPGEFLMGSTPEEIEDIVKTLGSDARWQAQARSEGPQHRVILTRPIYLTIHEVTQRQFLATLGKKPSHFAQTGPRQAAVVRMDTNDHPVEGVSWNDAAEFCAKLSRDQGLQPFYFRTSARESP